MGGGFGSRVCRLRPAASFESYLTEPFGCYVAAANAAAFWANEALSGVALWDHPGDSDVNLVTRALGVDARVARRLHALLLDFRQLQLIDLRCFGALWSTLTSHFRSLGTAVQRRAVMVPPGPAGVVVAELMKLDEQTALVRAFTNPEEALVWTEVADHALLDNLDRIVRVPIFDRSVVAGARRLLDRDPALPAEQVARALGLSQRTFQRRLREQGTSFQREVNAAHLRIAKRLMRKTDKPLKWIAIESGYASLQHFSASFRAHVGIPPSRWRAGGA